MNDGSMREELAERGMETVRARHTCANRVDELLSICTEMNGGRELAYETRA